ncbi:MAG: helix-turn-helix transcriptional regulator [Acidovorax sp.]|uniref:helix-turn-helix transcriptional regulator n=1 Tax=Acidovorax sp. TaxID=1872122 RepID=UPI0015F613E7
MTDTALLHRLEKMTSAMQLMAAMLGTRLDRAQLADRLGIHRNTLRQRLASDTSFPRPGKDGKWLLSEVIEWEQRQ